MRRIDRSLPCVVALVCGWLSTASALAQNAEPTKKGFDPKYVAAPCTKIEFFEMQASCLICHQARTPLLESLYKDTQAFDRVGLEETKSWLEKDFHDQAALALKTPRAEAMGKLLGYDVSKSTQCLNCHTGQQKITERPDQPPVLAAPTEEIQQFGVSCQACHGPSNNWEQAHRAPAKSKDAQGKPLPPTGWWRKTSDEKYQLGLLDVRRPTTRAQICLSCHLGSSAEGKILTHEMYAAGHPPLQNFEVETFVASMPYHGILLEEKVKNSKDSHKDWYEADDFYRTRSALTGSLVALRMQVQLVWDESRWAATKPADAKPNPDAHQARWPELAYFNCASCHHELAEDRRAPDRAASAAPGRPMIRSWPTALYEVAVLGAGIESKPGESILKPLETALARNPFGRAKEVAAAAEQVAAQLDAELARFEAKPIDRAAALGYLRAITTVGLSRPIDYEEARQLAWAAQTIVRELKTNAAGANASHEPALEPIERAAADLAAELEPNFPRKPPKSVVGGQVDFAPAYHPLLLEFGAKSLEKAVKYDERDFRRRLEALQKIVAPKS